MIDDSRIEYEPPNVPPELNAVEPAAGTFGAGQLPLALDVIAFAYLVVGWIGISEMLLQMIVFGRPSINFVAPLAVLTGHGLRRWDETWRRWALFFSWLILIAGVGGAFCCTFVLITDALKNSDEQIGSWWSPAGIGILAATLSAAFAWWQIGVLRRHDVVARFMMRDSEQRAGGDRQSLVPKRRWQFSLRSMLLAMLVAAFVLTRLTSDDVRFVNSSQTIASPALWAGFNRPVIVSLAEVGVRTSRFGPKRTDVTYVVLSRGDRGTGHVQTKGQPPDETAWLRTPDGRSIRLPGKFQLYEFADGELQTRNERVTLGELQSFLRKAGSAGWTLDGLIEHAEAMRVKAAR